MDARNKKSWKERMKNLNLKESLQERKKRRK